MDDGTKSNDPINIIKKSDPAYPKRVVSERIAYQKLHFAEITSDLKDMGEKARAFQERFEKLTKKE